MRVGEEAMIVAEAHRMVAGKTPDHQRFAEHPQHRAIGEQAEKQQRRRQQQEVEME